MTLILRGPGPGGGPGGELRSEINSYRVGAPAGGGGFTGEHLVQLVCRMDPSPTLPRLAINGVPAQVVGLPKTSLGDYRRIRVCAPVPNVNGVRSVPGISTGVDLLTIDETTLLPTPRPLKQLNLQNLRLVLRIRNRADGTLLSYVARPFNPTHASVVRSWVRRDGPYLREEVTLCQFVLEGAPSFPDPRYNRMLCAYVVRTSRCDHRAETLDIITENSAWRPDSNFAQVNGACDGEVWFQDYRLQGLESTDRVSRFQPRATFTVVGTNDVHLVTDAGSASQLLNWIGPSSYFVRRIVVYRLGEVSTQIARDILDRRDWGIVDGPLGYTHGGYGEMGGHFLRWKELPSVRGYPAGTYAGVNGHGDAIESSMRSWVDVGIVQGGDNFAHHGWFKPWGIAAPGQASEIELDNHGFSSPSPGGIVNSLLRLDGMIERHHLATCNLRDARPAQIGDYVEHSGQANKIPYSFGGSDRAREYLVNQLRIVPTTAGPGPHDLVPTDLPWNAPPSGWSCPHLISDGGAGTAPHTPPGMRKSMDWQRRSGLLFGPHYFTHSGRTINAIRGPLYVVDDFAAELALRYQGLAALAGYSPFDVVNPGADRFGFGRTNYNLKHIVGSALLNPASVPGIGWWHESGSIGSPRNWLHAYAVIQMLYDHMSAAERAVIEQPGNDWADLLTRFIEHVCTPVGSLFANQSHDDIHGGPPPNMTTREGRIPRGPQAPGGPDPAWYTGMHVFHEAYGGQTFPGLLQNMLLHRPSIVSRIDVAINLPDLWEDAVESYLGDGTQFAFLADQVCAPGNNGLGNTPLSEAQVRAGDAVWIGRYFTQPQDRKFWSYIARIPAYFMRYGSWGKCLKGAKRNYWDSTLGLAYDDPTLLFKLVHDLIDSYYNAGTGLPNSAGTPSDFKVQVAHFIGLLQSEGVAYPS